MLILRNIRPICKVAVLSCFIVAFYACCNTTAESNSTELITDIQEQGTIFNNLITLTNDSIPQDQVTDSMAFLILPLEASCPSCRKKTIDSILKHKDNLADRHYIILSVAGGKKTINSFFEEHGATVPEIKSKIFLDTTVQALKTDLCKDNPVIYYAAGQKTYKKVTAVPATVRNDLQEFFSGTRSVPK